MSSGSSFPDGSSSLACTAGNKVLPCPKAANGYSVEAARHGLFRNFEDAIEVFEVDTGEQILQGGRGRDDGAILDRHPFTSILTQFLSENFLGLECFI